MEIKRFPRTSDAIRIVVVADDKSKHGFMLWEDHGDGGAKAEALAIERVKRKVQVQPHG